MSPLVLCANRKPSCCGTCCWRSLVEPGFPISTAQSDAHIPRLTAELLQSPTSIHPCLQRHSAIFLASKQPVVHPLCGGLFPPRQALSACFSHGFWGSVFLTQQRVPKPAGGVLKQGATRSVHSLWHLSRLLFFFFFFLTSCISHSQEDGDPYRDAIWSLPKALNSTSHPGQAAACPCFECWQNWVEEDQVEYLMTHWFSH